MGKPRIIIADTDERYIASLQLKFVEDFFEKVDLEIITDRGVFEEIFLSPQNADILIISEDLYDERIQRHNIMHIFLMMEQYDEEQTGDLNVNRIFKYTSIIEIFNEIIAKSAGSFKMEEMEKKETQVILLYSASGGTGKTTLAMGISACLTKHYKRVLYINAEHLQYFQRVLENPAPITSNEVYAKLSNITDNIYKDIKHLIRKEWFFYLPPFKAALVSLGVEYSFYEKFILSAKKSGEYDFIIVDADTVFDEEKTRLFGISDKVIIVTEQNASAVYATNVLATNVTGMNTEKYVFICNNFDRDEENALISPNISLRFKVHDYVEHIKHYNQIRNTDLAKESGIQRVTVLIM